MKKEMRMRVLYIGLIVLAFATFIFPFWISIVFGGSIAFTLYPVQLFLEKKGMKRNHAAALLTSVFALIISIPLTFFLVRGTIVVTRQLEKLSINDRIMAQGVAELVSDLRQDLVQSVHKYSSQYELLDFLTVSKIDKYIGSINQFLLGFFQGIAGSLPTLFILLLVIILCTYSFLKHASSIRHFFQKLTGFSDSKMDELTDIFIKDSRQVYLTNIATGGIQSLIVGTGVKLLGLGDFFLVFFMTLILSFIPVVGAAPVSFIFSMIAFFKGLHTEAFILFGLGVFTGLIDNILRPFIATYGQSKIPPVVAFVCVIGGAYLLGFPGLFIGLLVGSIAYDTLPVFWESLE